MLRKKLKLPVSEAIRIKAVIKLRVAWTSAARAPLGGLRSLAFILRRSTTLDDYDFLASRTLGQCDLVMETEKCLDC